MGTYKYFLNQEVIEGKRLIEEVVACGDFIATYIHGVILLCESNPEGIGNLLEVLNDEHETLHDYLKKYQSHFLPIFPDIDQPWKTPFAFWITNWTVAHYLYIWYLLNEYYLCLHFEPKFYSYISPQGNKYFHKF